MVFCRRRPMPDTASTQELTRTAEEAEVEDVPENQQ